MIERALAKFLLSEPTITNLVGTRITRERKRADRRFTAPELGETAITIARITTERNYTLSGPEIGAAVVILRIDCWARGPNAWPKCDDIFEALRQLLSGWRGDWHDVYVHGSTIEQEGTEADAPVDSSDYWDASYGFDLRVTHWQPIAAPTDD